MDTMKMIKERHSVRKYLDKPIEADTLAALNAEIDRVNELSGLHICYGNSKDGRLGNLALKVIGWKNCQGALVLAGPKGMDDLHELCGYWGEHLVLFCQHLGLNTCWAGMANQKDIQVTLEPGDEYVIAVGVGYGVDQGRERKSKTYDQVTVGAADAPEWFKAGIESALLAPTAVNQQKFTFELQGEDVVATAPNGNFTRVDLGIVAYHFEAASGKKVEMR